MVRTNVGEINALRDQLNRANDENARLRNAIDESNRNPKQEVKKTAASNLIIFRIGRADLSKEARANLGLLAEAIKLLIRMQYTPLQVTQMPERVARRRMNV